jgi:hypothetical protein
MRPIFIAAAALTMLSAAAAAQNPSQTAPQNAPIKSPDANNSPNPVKGANSFTEKQARSRIEARGYTNIAGLRKDQDGIWRATAQKDGKPVPVSLDYQGNVN